MTKSKTNQISRLEDYDVIDDYIFIPKGKEKERLQKVYEKAREDVKEKGSELLAKHKLNELFSTK